MFLVEPPQSPYDLRFHVGPVPVRVHPFFWLMAVLLGISGPNPDGWQLLIWIAVVFVSILVHELGHIIAMYAYGERGHIVLYSFGGMAVSDRMTWQSRGRTPFSQIVISAAGPLAGFILALLAATTFVIGGGKIVFGTELPFLDQVIQPRGTSTYVLDAFRMLWSVNILWGLLNLLPVYPLDGGQIARELFQLRNPHNGIIQSLWLSLITAATLAALAMLRWNMPFAGIFFVLMAVNSYMAISQLTGRGFGGRPRW